MSKIDSGFLNFIFGGVIGSVIVIMCVNFNKPKPLKCTHPTERQIILKHEKYEMFLDKIQSVKDKEKINSLVDSLNKYCVK